MTSLYQGNSGNICNQDRNIFVALIYKLHRGWQGTYAKATED